MISKKADKITYFKKLNIQANSLILNIKLYLDFQVWTRIGSTLRANLTFPLISFVLWAVLVQI